MLPDNITVENVNFRWDRHYRQWMYADVAWAWLDSRFRYTRRRYLHAA
jgi:hypothetical protein